jgi:hypothetical protein
MAFFDPRAEVGVVTLANGNWRSVDGRWPLEQIALLLFDRAGSDAGSRGLVGFPSGGNR